MHRMHPHLRTPFLPDSYMLVGLSPEKPDPSLTGPHHCLPEMERLFDRAPVMPHIHDWPPLLDPEHLHLKVCVFLP